MKRGGGCRRFHFCTCETNKEHRYIQTHLNNDCASSVKVLKPGKDVSGFEEYLLLHRKQGQRAARHMILVFLLLVSLNVFQLIRNCRVTSLISLPSRTAKSRKYQFDQLLAY